jgi:hypothetical protein
VPGRAIRVIWGSLRAGGPFRHIVAVVGVAALGVAAIGVAAIGVAAMVVVAVFIAAGAAGRPGPDTSEHKAKGRGEGSGPQEPGYEEEFAPSRIGTGPATGQQAEGAGMVVNAGAVADSIIAGDPGGALPEEKASLMARRLGWRQTVQRRRWRSCWGESWNFGRVA